MALVGNMIQQAIGGNPSIVNYAMFVAVFSMLTLLYQIAATLNEGFVVLPVLPLVCDALNTLFFLVGGIALAAYLGVHSCMDAVRSTDLPRLHARVLLLGKEGNVWLTDMAATGLRQQQLRHLGLLQQHQALPGGAGGHGLPVVRLRGLRGLARLHGAERVQLARQPARRHRRHPPRRGTEYVAGLRRSRLGARDGLLLTGRKAASRRDTWMASQAGPRIAQQKVVIGWGKAWLA